MEEHASCIVCRKQTGKEERPPGGYIYEGKHFVVCHGPLSMSTRGTMLVESKRHFLDYGEMKEDEGAELIEMLRKLFPSMKKATGADRIYSVAMMDGAPHFHLWLVPKRKGGRLRGVGYLASRHTPPTRKAAEEVSREIKSDF